MEHALYQRYMKLTSYLEEPIREIVPAIWQLPYVVDTRHCCSGHIITGRIDGYQYWSPDSSLTSTRIEKGWYPHRATLQIDFTLDDRVKEERDCFIQALFGVVARVGEKTLYFRRESGYFTESQDSFQKSVRSRPFGTPFPPQGPDEILVISYDANIDSMFRCTPKTRETVEEGEALLTAFWEGVAEVVRQYNPKAKIGPIQGKSFRHSITWAEWKCVFPYIFDENVKKPEEPGIM